MKTIAFDLDGTLLDSRERHRTVMQSVFNDLGIKADLSDMLSIKSEGKSNKEYLKIKGFDGSQIQLICSHWQKIIEDNIFLQEDCLYSDSLQFLTFLKQAGYRLVLITARNNRAGLSEQIRDLGLTALLDKIYAVASGKDTVQEKAEALRDCQAVLFIGDTEADRDAAQKSGIKFSAMNRGFRNKTFWERLAINSFEDFETLKQQELI